MGRSMSAQSYISKLLVLSTGFGEVYLGCEGVGIVIAFHERGTGAVVLLLHALGTDIVGVVAAASGYYIFLLLLLG